MKQCAVLFSGGRDSFVSVCKIIEKGYQIHLLTFDNGCMSGLGSIHHGVTRLRKMYKDVIVYDNIIGIAENLCQLRNEIENQPIKDIAKDYPHLLVYQLNCLLCHSLMYVGAINYCLSNNIKFLVDGGRVSQGFIVELPEMVGRYKDLCNFYDIEVYFPVLNISDDYVIKEEMASRGFLPKVLEPQCWIGCPIRKDLTELQCKDLIKYYDKVILPKLKGLVSI